MAKRNGERMSRKLQFLLNVLAVTLLTAAPLACNIDGLIVTELTRGDHRPMPEPALQTVTGSVENGPSAVVSLLGADGKALGTAQATALANGSFELPLAGDMALNNAILTARTGSKQWLAVVPKMAAQSTVLAPPRQIPLSSLSPGALQLNDVTTAMTLLLVAKLRSSKQTLAGASTDGVLDTLIELHKKIMASDAEPALTMVVAAVARIRSQSNPVTTIAVALGAWNLGTEGSLLRSELLTSQSIDFDGDSLPDLETAKFDALLAAALPLFSFKACYMSDKIRVVVQTRLVNAGGKDGNCDATFNPYLWTDKASEKVVFITGGIHKDTSLCSLAGAIGCVPQAQVDAANTALGNWIPNQIRMYDDGSHGDGVAGDGIWTIALELPYIEPIQGTAPVRIAYKFTYGKPAQGWTDSEEFPGNQRLLELVDVDGDHIVTRFDLFADETTNKDKKNSSQQGCGEVLWTGIAKKGCLNDVRERKVDLDGDCLIDGWPTAGTAGPLAVPCAK